MGLYSSVSLAIGTIVKTTAEVLATKSIRWIIQLYHKYMKPLALDRFIGLRACKGGLYELGHVSYKM